MFDLMLFTDGSVNTQTRIGFGAYLAVEDIQLPLADLKNQVNVKQFQHTSSTKLELQTLLWAMDDAPLITTAKLNQLTIVTDSQNILGLQARRKDLERQDYVARNGKRLHHAELYQQFFKAIDQLNCQIIKVDGHKPQHTKNDIDRVFALVDKMSRLSLRKLHNRIR